MSTKLIIDTCIIDRNFGVNFPKLKNLLTSGKVLVVYGGTKYAEEMKRNSKLTDLISQLVSAGLTKRIKNNLIDAEHLRVNAIFLGNQTCVRHCDDPHLFAIYSIANADYIITKDTRISKCHRCLRERLGNQFGVTRPKILSSDHQVESSRRKGRI